MSTDWMLVRERIASILYSQGPLAERYEAIYKQFEVLRQGHLSAVRPELDSMAHTATGNRETPFLDVGKDLLTYCDQQLSRQLELRGEDPRWVTELRRREREIEDGDGLGEMGEEENLS